MNVGSWGPADFSAAAAVAGVVVAIVVGWYAYAQVKLARDLREQQVRPYVIVDFEFKRELVSIAVSNIGATPARNVVVSFDRPLEASEDQRGRTNINDATIFTAPIPFMAPGRKMVVPLDSGPRLFKAERIALAYTASVSYTGEDTNQKPHVEQYPLDLLPFKHTAIDGPGVGDIANRLKDIQQVLTKVMATSGHVRVKTTDQDIEELREGRAYRVERGREVLKKHGFATWVRWWFEELAVRYGWKWR